jgi:DNA (cytosine-5)-methyltransferase 1
MTLTVGSLFSGIGGIDLGLERAGMTVKWQSEIDPFACKVLKKHWPDTPNLGDIKQIDWSTVEPVDVIAGGYPCQPFSTAGKRQGENDPRHLWPYFRDAISGIRPQFAILENVRGHLSMGFDRVLADLAEVGYDAEWQIVSAASVGAPHRRERIICVAYTNLWQVGRWDRWNATDRNQVFSRRNNQRGTQSYEGWQWWEVEPDVGRVADGVPRRVDRLRGLGNAVVPQVAEYVGRLIMEAHNERPI